VSGSVLLLTVVMCERNCEGACDVDSVLEIDIIIIIPQLAGRVTNIFLR